MNSNIPTSEKRRLEILWQYDVLDSEPEQVFDDLVELAAYICEAPMAMITLVDENRQWFKARLGVTMKETTRDISFCTHAIAQPRLSIVPDATRDVRFANNPFVLSKPKIRFYAGAPLVTQDGHALGTLCVLDKVPRKLRPEQQKALIILARHVMSHLDSRKALHEHDQVREERNELKRRLARAKSRGPGAAATLEKIQPRFISLGSKSQSREA